MKKYYEESAWIALGYFGLCAMVTVILFVIAGVYELLCWISLILTLVIGGIYRHMVKSNERR